MKRVKNYFTFIKENKGKLLASQPVSQIASFIDPDLMKSKKTKEEVEEENPGLSSYGSGYDPELGGSKKVEPLFCGEVIVSGSTYEVLSGPNKGKSGTLKWTGGMDPVFDLPVGVNSFSELNPPNEESIKLIFPGIDLYKNFLTAEYDNTEEKYLTKLKYYDAWQTYGNVEITFNRDSSELYDCWNWECIDGPNSGMKGNILVWQGTEDLLKGTNSVSWKPGEFRIPKGVSPIEGMIYPNWALGGTISYDSSAKGILNGESVDFPSTKRGESSEIKSGNNYPRCEDPQHFLYLGLPSGKIKPPSNEDFYNFWYKIFVNNDYIDNTYTLKTFKDNGFAFVIEGSINGNKSVFFPIESDNEENPSSAFSGDPLDPSRKGGKYGNLGFYYLTSEYKTYGKVKVAIPVTGEWYWDFEKNQIGVVAAKYQGKVVSSFEKASPFTKFSDGGFGGGEFGGKGGGGSW